MRGRNVLYLEKQKQVKNTLPNFQMGKKNYTKEQSATEFVRIKKGE